MAIQTQTNLSVGATLSLVASVTPKTQFMVVPTNSMNATFTASTAKTAPKSWQPADMRLDTARTALSARFAALTERAQDYQLKDWRRILRTEHLELPSILPAVQRGVLEERIAINFLCSAATAFGHEELVPFFQSGLGNTAEKVFMWPDTRRMRPEELLSGMSFLSRRDPSELKYFSALMKRAPTQVFTKIEYYEFFAYRDIAIFGKSKQGEIKNLSEGEFESAVNSALIQAGPESKDKAMALLETLYNNRIAYRGLDHPHLKVAKKLLEIDRNAARFAYKYLIAEGSMAFKTSTDAAVAMFEEFKSAEDVQYLLNYAMMLRGCSAKIPFENYSGIYDLTARVIEHIASSDDDRLMEQLPYAMWVTSRTYYGDKKYLARLREQLLGKVAPHRKAAILEAFEGYRLER